MKYEDWEFLIQHMIEMYKHMGDLRDRVFHLERVVNELTKERTAEESSST